MKPNQYPGRDKADEAQREFAILAGKVYGGKGGAADLAKMIGSRSRDAADKRFYAAVARSRVPEKA